VSGLTATSDIERSNDFSTWVLRVDPSLPDALFVTWVKEGTNQLDEVKFRKKR
jgi:hypothetical protein